MAGVKSMKDEVGYSDGSIVSKTVIDKKTGTITLFGFDKGQALSEHTAPFDAVAHILDGSAEITIGGEKYALKKGEYILMPANVPHGVRAGERFKMLLIMIK